MKRALAAVLCLCAPAAWGQTTLDYDFTYVGTYTPAGMTQAAGVYDLTFTVWPGDLGAIVLDVGRDYLGYGGNPFQVGIQMGSRCITTPTVNDANDWLATETFARQSDSHFLIPDTPVIVYPPQENNDGSLGTYTDPCGQTEARGLGGLRVAVAVLMPDRVPVMDVLRVGILSGTPVYLGGQIARQRNLPDGAYDVEARDLEAVQLPMAYQNAWQGAGTGGQTSTDPNDPTVQWNQLANWSRGVLPDLRDGVRVEMGNPGLLVAASGSVGSLYVDSSSPGTSFHIPGSADVSVTGSLIVGEHSTATATQSGTARSFFFSLGENPGAAGSYELTDGRLTVDSTAYVGKDGVGTFSQAGGTMQVAGTLWLGRFGKAMGTYRLRGGHLAAGTVSLAHGQSLFEQTGGSVSSDRVSISRTSMYQLTGGEVRTPVEDVGGTFVQTGGKNAVTDLLRVTWYGGGARYELRGGALNADRIYVGTATYVEKASTFYLAGGEVNATTADLAGYVVQEGGLLNVTEVYLSFSSAFQLRGGGVRTDLLGMGGSFAQNGGWVHANRIDVETKHKFELNDGQIMAGIENVRGSFIQTGGTNLVTSALAISTDRSDRAVYQLRGGVLSAATISGLVSLSGGAFSVQAMDGVLVNDGGVISPGSSIGTMSLGGLVQNAGILDIELASLIDFDKIYVTESAQLGGELKIDLLGGYLPAIGSEYPILTAGSGVTGAFALVSEGYETRVDGGDTLMLVVIPEPAAACLIALGGAGFLLRRPEAKRRKAGPLPMPVIFAGVWPARRTRPWRGVWASGRTGSG